MVTLRIKHVPKFIGADWRDLPNQKIMFPDGTHTDILRYPYVDYETGKGAVCECRAKKNGVIFLI